MFELTPEQDAAIHRKLLGDGQPGLTPLERELCEALELAMQWIKAWDVGFLFDDDWAADEAKITAALQKAKDRT
jgi:hypothetical protein